MIVKMKEKRLPKLNYYEEFIKNANISLEMSNILKEFIENYENNDAKGIEKKVHLLENEADQNLHCLRNFLIRDFLPPIDREDIMLLANKIDDVIDDIDEIVINLNIFNILTLRKDISNFVEHINNFCKFQKEMMDKFKISKKLEDVNELIIEINRLEEHGDKLYENAIKNLFQEKDPIEIIKWKKIYTSFEECFDSFESVADTVGEIVLKNS